MKSKKNTNQFQVWTPTHSTLCTSVFVLSTVWAAKSPSKDRISSCHRGRDIVENCSNANQWPFKYQFQIPASNQTKHTVSTAHLVAVKWFSALTWSRFRDPAPHDDHGGMRAVLLCCWIWELTLEGVQLFLLEKVVGQNSLSVLKVAKFSVPPIPFLPQHCQNDAP